MNFRQAVVTVTVMVLTANSSVPAASEVMSPSLEAAELTRKALSAQGGEDALRGVTSVEWTATGYRNMVEQSERPEGPYSLEFQTVIEAQDLVHGRRRIETVSTVYPYGSYSTTITIADGIAMRAFGTSEGAGDAKMLAAERERIALSPERLLLTAAAAPDLHLERDVTMQSVRQNVLGFALDGAPVRIYLNAFTHLPTAVDYSGPAARTDYWALLGNVTQRTYYGSWVLESTGVRYPMQWNVEGNGLPDRVLAIHDLKMNADLPDSRFAISPKVRAGFAAAQEGQRPDTASLAAPKEIDPGIMFLPGSWNTTIVRQEDGLVVIEAPISPAYSEKVIAEAARRYPGVPIKAVVTTSDSWPHFAGLRSYEARGIPIYALDLNVPVLTRNARAAYEAAPDLQQKAKRRPRFRPVSSRTIIGSGPNQIELYPLRGETTERQMMAYFPNRRLLYGSDAFQRDPTGKLAFPQTIDEVTGAVAREKLDVERFFMMHVGPTPWAEVAGDRQNVRAPGSSAGER